MTNLIKKYELNNEEMQYLSLILDSIKNRKGIELKGNVIIRRLASGIIDISIYPIDISRCKKCLENVRQGSENQ